ncbi:MAG TPA: LysR family transcriptional regulator [Ilumatobacteraceae bacterium]|nr:LysR family transcriptional regulator [Ilumatobacteraceae bacterium]
MLPSGPPLPDVSIRQFEYLVAVAEEPTWSKAAARVGVSASALSQGLAELERRLGVALFDRDGRRRPVRDAATPVVAHARQVLALTGDLAQWADRVRTGRSGRLRLGMIDAAAVVHYPEVLREFRSARPDVDLLLRVAPSAPLLELLVGGELDLVVCVEPPEPRTGIETERLAVEELAVYCPPGVTIGEPASWGPWVLFPSGSHTRSVLIEVLRRAGAPLDVVAESHQPEVLREMVHLGTGWTVLPTSQAEHGERPLGPGRPITTRHLVIATRAGSVRDPAVENLCDALRRASV